MGYEPISVPYIVDLDIVKFTLPKDRVAWEHGDFGYYVGSAEQSIYQMIKDGVELPNKMMAITPCQRDEVVDESHLEIFLKIELVSLDHKHTFINIMHDVLKYIHYSGLDYGHELTNVLQDDQISYDINLNGIEIGSYGCRTYNDIVVHYGTGLALPRFEYARNK